jgi:hypothetical protein
VKKLLTESFSKQAVIWKSEYPLERIKMRCIIGPSNGIKRILSKAFPEAMWIAQFTI